MFQLYADLSTDEVKEFCSLLKSLLDSVMPISEVAQKLLELFGAERKHLLASKMQRVCVCVCFNSFFSGMRSFIKPAQKADFEWILEQNGINDNAACKKPKKKPQTNRKATKKKKEQKKQPKRHCNSVASLLHK